MTATQPVCDVEQCSDESHYACRLRSKGLQVSPRAQMTRSQNWRPTKSEPPAFNRQIMYVDRPGGTKMPILKPDGTPLRRKEFGEKRHTVERILRSHNPTNAIAP